jgi:hypothetical protein
MIKAHKTHLYIHHKPKRSGDMLGFKYCLRLNKIFYEKKVMNSYLKFVILSGTFFITAFFTYKAGVEVSDPIYAKIVKEHFRVLEHIKSSFSLLKSVKSVTLNTSSMLKMITLHSEYQLGYEDARLLAQYSQLTQYDIPGVIHLTANECENIFSKEFFEVFEKSGIEVDTKVIRDLMPSPPKTPLNYNDK